MTPWPPRDGSGATTLTAVSPRGLLYAGKSLAQSKFPAERSIRRSEVCQKIVLIDAWEEIGTKKGKVTSIGVWVIPGLREG